jgi:putative hydrolase of the HAD superfamily
VLFDAVGTLISPTPSVASTYHSFGQLHGSKLALHEVQSRIARLRGELFGPREDKQLDFSNVHLPSNDESEREIWYQMVTRVFTDIENHRSLFRKLWEHFAAPGSWHVFPDVKESWQRLKNAGHQIGIASNFDSRLSDICRALEPLSSADYIFYSAGLGFRKPDLRFFRAIELSVATLARPLMIGDNRIYDVEAPRQLGWRSLLIDRTGANVAEDTVRDLVQASKIILREIEAEDRE